jgi:hypothetical protein
MEFGFLFLFFFLPPQLRRQQRSGSCSGYADSSVSLRRREEAEISLAKIAKTAKEDKESKIPNPAKQSDFFSFLPWRLCVLARVISSV